MYTSFYALSCVFTFYSRHVREEDTGIIVGNNEQVEIVGTLK